MTKPPDTLTIACLEHAWWGICIGGKHYTGEIHVDDKTIEVIRKLSRREAKELSESEESRKWPVSTNKFDSLESLEQAAIKWCNENLGHKWILLENDKLNPNRAIGSRGYSTTHIKRINNFQRWWWELSKGEREMRWKRAYEIWDKLL